MFVAEVVFTDRSGLDLPGMAALKWQQLVAADGTVKISACPIHQASSICNKSCFSWWQIRTTFSSQLHPLCLVKKGVGCLPHRERQGMCPS